MELDASLRRDNIKGLIDVLAGMDTFEQQTFELEIKPICTALVKVRNCGSLVNMHQH